MKISHQRSSKKSNKWLVISVLALAAVAGTYFTYAYITKSQWPFAEKIVDTTSVTRNVNDVDYNPPTQEDIDSSQNGKKNTASQNATEQKPNQPDTEKRKIAIGVTFADVIDGKVEVRAFTPSIIEGGGTCTAIFTNAEYTVTATSKAFIDSSSTQCTPIYINTSEFKVKGVWLLNLSYSSTTATGSSDPIEVTL